MGDLKELENIIINFNKQFLFKPKIIYFNKINFNKINKIILIGMGGSHLAMDLLKILFFKKEIKIYSDYSVLKKDLNKDNFFILSSYSGNTEEIIDIFYKLKNKYNIFVISKNGKLLKLAKRYKINYIQLPNDKIMPRYALGYFLKTFLFIFDKKQAKLLENISLKIDFLSLKKMAQNISKKIKNKILIIYSNFENLPLALHFKIKLNETSKWPAFINFLPEANHNEIISFINPFFKSKFLVIFLKDKYDYKKNLKNFEILQFLFKKEGIEFINLELDDKIKIKKILKNIILVDWLSYYLAKKQQISPIKIDFIEKVKDIKNMKDIKKYE